MADGYNHYNPLFAINGNGHYNGFVTIIIIVIIVSIVVTIPLLAVVDHDKPWLRPPHMAIPRDVTAHLHAACRIDSFSAPPALDERFGSGEVKGTATPGIFSHQL